MPRGLSLVRRRVVRSIPAILLVIAIAAYATLLSTTHDATKNAMLERHDEQLFGSAASGGANVLVDRAQGAIELGRSHATRAYANWRIGPIDKRLESDTSIRSEELFVTGLGFSLDATASFVTIDLDGRPIQDLRPAPASPPRPGPYPVGNVALQPIDISPGYEMGFRFPVPPDGACVTRACTVTIHTTRSVWVIRRIGLLFSTERLVPALWIAPLAAWKIFGIAALLAIASHILLSLRASNPTVPPPKEWKPI